MTESDKKAVEELEDSVFRFVPVTPTDKRLIRDFILKTRQEARNEIAPFADGFVSGRDYERQRILDLPCMQDESAAQKPEWQIADIMGKNDLRREIRDALNKK